MPPSVTAIMLYADRPQFLDGSVSCFRAQTYPNKRLLILDNGRRWIRETISAFDETDISMFPVHGGNGVTIGALRNMANELSESEILIHLDVDDWSHPERITEQVALLQSSGASAVGYRELLFWDQRPGHFCGAWLFRSGNTQYCCGTSLCYWREIWQQRPFPATSYGEETEWLRGVKAHTVPSWGEDGTPRMIARIHGGNTSHQFGSYDSKMMEANAKDGREWSRAPEWDEHCRRIMT